MEYLLAHDVGTTGCKTAIVTVDGQLLTTVHETYPTYYPHPLWSEQAPEDWWRAIVRSTRRVMDTSGVKAEQILGMGFSTTMTNIVALDSQGNLLRPCIYWLDGRAGEEAQLVMRKLGGEKIFNLLLGATVSGKDLLPKYLWLKRNEAETYQKAAVFLDSSGYLINRATGRLAYEWSVASGLGLFNLKTKTWETGMMRFFGLDAQKFPALVGSAEPCGGLTPEVAVELGLLADTPVFAGAGDPLIAAVGSGTVKEGEAFLNLGTSAFIGVITNQRVSGRRGIVTLQSADPDKLLLFGETSTAGACLEWALRAIYGVEPDPATFASMDQDVDQAEPGAGGLIFTPWMYGERCPVPDESLRAAFINLGVNHTRQQMARAVFEGIAFNLRWILDSIKELYGFNCETLRVLGGGARSLPWLRVIADITGRRLEVLPNPQERLAVGAALVAAVGLGLYPSFEAIKPLVPVKHTQEPDLALWAAYERNYTAYRQVYSSLRGLYHQLNREK